MITRMTLYEIAGNPDDIIVAAGGPVKKGEFKGKFLGWITRGERHNYKTLINTAPVFNSAEDAKLFMQAIVDWAKEWTDTRYKQQSGRSRWQFQSGRVI